jgi:hypothetical protein
MNEAVEMGSGAMICTKFHKDWFRHSEVDSAGFTDSKLIS